MLRKDSQQSSKSLLKKSLNSLRLSHQPFILKNVTNWRSSYAYDDSDDEKDITKISKNTVPVDDKQNYNCIKRTNETSFSRLPTNKEEII